MCVLYQYRSNLNIRCISNVLDFFPSTSPSFRNEERKRGENWGSASVISEKSFLTIMVDPKIK